MNLYISSNNVSMCNFNIICLIIIFCFVLINYSIDASSNTINNNYYQTLWEEVKKAKSDGLPQTAMQKLEPILRKSLEDKNYLEYIKAITEKIVLEGNIQGNKPEEKIIRLEKELETTPLEIKPMLKLILANWYWHFYQRNKWRFINRTEVFSSESKDFTTWDLPRLFKHISKLFDESLENEKDLQNTPIENWLGFLESGNQPLSLRPTLYDFFVHEALEFFTSDEQTSALPQDAFELNSESPVLGPVNEFLLWKPETTDTESPKLKAIKLFQKLLTFHIEKNNEDALIDLDIYRLVWAYQNSYGEDKDKRFINQLIDISKKYKHNELSSLALFYAAKKYYDLKDFVTALELAQEGYSRYPNSVWGKNCLGIINVIKQKKLEISTERVIGEYQPDITINYANIEKVYFRLIKVNLDELLKTEYTFYPNSLSWNFYESVLKEKPVLEWDVDLPKVTDYKTHTHNTKFPKVSKGTYILLASHNKEFSKDDNALRAVFVWISNLALIAKQTSNSIGGIVLNNNTGEPIENATIYIYKPEAKNTYSLVSQTKTNRDGTFKVEKRFIDQFLILAEYNNDIVSDTDFFYKNFYGSDETFQKKLILFKDRAIYRPGQTIHIKGILVSINHKNNEYKTIPNHEITLFFKDPNGQIIEEKKFKTNEFGSFSGTFIIPTNRLNGSYLIQSNSPYSVHHLQIEEYKRPKFKVELDAPSQEVKLGDEVSIKGRAISYTGAYISSAKVKYRVVREANYPRWLWWYHNQLISKSQEIAFGTTTTDDEGKFEIKFVAKPDKSISPKDQPTFTYTIYTEITDTTGETRSQTKFIKLGYSDLNLEITLPDYIQSNQPFKAVITTKSLNDIPIPTVGVIKIYTLRQPTNPIRPNLQSYYNETDSTTTQFSNWQEESEVLTYNFNTNKEGIDITTFTLPEGIYRIIAISKDKNNNEVKSIYDKIVIDQTSTKFNIKIPFYFVPLSSDVEPGQTFSALWGSGYEKARAFIEIEHRGRIINSFWTDKNSTQQIIEVPITESMRGGLSIHILQVKENVIYKKTHKINVPWSNKKLKLSLERFNSKTSPQQKETISIKITGPNALSEAIEVVACMYDASLDAFIPHQWISSLDFLFLNDYSKSYYRFSNALLNLISISDFIYQYIPFLSRTYPSLPSYIKTNFFGYEFKIYRGMHFKENFEDIAETSNSRSIMPKVFMAREPAPIDKMMAEPPNTESLKAAGSSIQEGASRNDSLADKTSTPSQIKDITFKDTLKDVNLDSVSIRKNLQETAFFYPHLLADKDGNVTITFTVPEALTTWKFMSFAHTQSCKSGSIFAEIISQKDLMVQPNPPRFLREGDKIVFTAKVTNLTDNNLNGKIRLTLHDPTTDKIVNEIFSINNSEQEFEIKGKLSNSYSWEIIVPNNLSLSLLTYKVVAATHKYSDGEEGYLPIISSKVFITETVPIYISGPASKTYKVENLLTSKDKKIETYAITYQITSNPAWYAILALPYLTEFPHECSEQVFNRFYANTLAQYIANSNPAIQRIYKIWTEKAKQGAQTFISNLQKNEHLKNILLLETPWVCEAKSDTERIHNIATLFDRNRLNSELNAAFQKLANMQKTDGSWPWFPGGWSNPFITLYIVAGFGKLRHLGINTNTSLAIKAINFLDSWLDDIYKKLKAQNQLNNNNLSSTIALYLYARSFFIDDRPINSIHQEAFNYFIEQAQTYWLSIPERMSQAHIALALKRLGNKTTPIKIANSIKERSVFDDELGRFWRDTEYSYWWYRAPIETQAIMIELFDEVLNDQKLVEECKIWLLKQKQTQDWKSTKATADAIYALILKGMNWLSSNKPVKLFIANKEITPKDIEAGTGFYEHRIDGREVIPEFGIINISKEDHGIAWGGVFWQYFQDISEIKSYSTNLQITKSLYIKENTKSGPVLNPIKDKVKVGDTITVRIEFKTDRDMEFVHLKDQRASGFEPEDVLSGYKYQDGLAYYQTTKDTATHFFIDYLPKGQYVFEYNLKVQHKGVYQSGFAEIQCMYAPEFNARSNSLLIKAE